MCPICKQTERWLVQWAHCQTIAVCIRDDSIKYSFLLTERVPEMVDSWLITFATWATDMLAVPECGKNIPT